MIRSGEHAQWDAAMSEIMWAWLTSGPTSSEALTDIMRPFMEATEKFAADFAVAMRPMLAEMKKATAAFGAVGVKLAEIEAASGGSTAGKTTSRRSPGGSGTS